MNPKLVELSGAALNGVYSVSLYAPDADNPILKAWTTQYAKTFTNEPAFIGALGAQAVELIADGMDKAGTATDDDKIAEALKGQSWPTLLGDVKFDANGQALQSIYLIQVIKGRIVGAAGG